MEFNIGDTIELTKIGHFHPDICVGDQGCIHDFTGSGTGVNAYFTSRRMNQTILFHWNCMKKVKREIRKSGFAKFIKRIDTLEA